MLAYIVSICRTTTPTKYSPHSEFNPWEPLATTVTDTAINTLAFVSGPAHLIRMSPSGQRPHILASHLRGPCDFCSMDPATARSLEPRPLLALSSFAEDFTAKLPIA